MLTPLQFTLYKYCLGLEYKGFHVDSRRNMFYGELHYIFCVKLMFKSTVGRDWHKPFNDGHWFLLPDMETLKEVDDYVKTVIAWRKGMSSEAEVLSFYKQVHHL
jgi:hypothetical protein